MSASPMASIPISSLGKEAATSPTASFISDNKEPILRTVLPLIEDILLLPHQIRFGHFQPSLKLRKGL